jgi:hypothetical protein
LFSDSFKFYFLPFGPLLVIFITQVAACEASVDVRVKAFDERILIANQSLNTVRAKKSQTM